MATCGHTNRGSHCPETHSPIFAGANGKAGRRRKRQRQTLRLGDGESYCWTFGDLVSLSLLSTKPFLLLLSALLVSSSGSHTHSSTLQLQLAICLLHSQSHFHRIHWHLIKARTHRYILAPNSTESSTSVREWVWMNRVTAAADRTAAK